MTRSFMRDRIFAWMVACGLVLVGAGLAGVASAQNDWQYPDPYFGILEIEKSHNGPVTRRPRAELTNGTRAKPTSARSGLFRSRRAATAPRQR